jgi:hypothetical protein
LLDARWALPAGDYRVTVAASRGAQVPPGTTLDLQLGRLGPPIERWPLSLDPEGRWSQTFHLPLYVGSVGFGSHPDIAALAPTLTVQPLAVADQRARPPRLEVLQVARYDEAWVFFHDEQTYPERPGFWTRANTASAFTFVSPSGAVEGLRIRAGPVSTGVQVAIDDSRERFGLGPHESRELALSAGRGRPARVVIRTDGGFVPAAVDSDSTDRRNLGCWVEVISQRGVGAGPRVP